MEHSISSAPLNKNYEYADLIRNPKSLLLLLNKYIEVRLSNTSFQGFVRAIDPITNSIILLKPCGNSFKPSWILGHAILSILELTPEPHVKVPQCKKEFVTDLDIVERKAKMIAWLKGNLLPVTESGDNIVFGNVSLLPPYTVADICTSNPMVAMQMRKIIERMPQDFDPNKTTI